MKKDRVVSEVLGEEITLTPSDLYSKEFRTKVMGGYDKDEVEHFLERVADVFESLIKQNREIKARNEELRQDVESYHEMESTLRSALISSQKFHEDVLDHARREADAMLKEAKLAKSLAITKASKLPELLQQEINSLRAQRDQLRTELQAFLQSHTDMLNALPTAEASELTLAQENADQEPADEEESSGELHRFEDSPEEDSDAWEEDTAPPPAPSMKPERKGSTEALTRMLTRPMTLPEDEEQSPGQEYEEPRKQAHEQLDQDQDDAESDETKKGDSATDDEEVNP